MTLKCILELEVCPKQFVLETCYLDSMVSALRTSQITRLLVPIIGLNIMAL